MAAAAVVLFFGGLFALLSGWRGSPVPDAATTTVGSRLADRERLRRWAISLASGVGAFLITGWIGLALAAPAVTDSMLALYSDRARRNARRTRVEAIAAWLEMIRDTIASGAGFGSAVRLTARRAPGPIAAEVRRLSARLDSMSFSEAITRFGEEVDVAEADTAFVALATASRSAGGNLGRVLTVGVESLRDKVEQSSRIDALRSRFLTSAGLMVGATVASSAMVLLSSRQFRSSYESSTGQLVLVLVGAFFVLAVMTLRRMASEGATVRLNLAVRR